MLVPNDATGSAAAFYSPPNGGERDPYLTTLVGKARAAVVESESRVAVQPVVRPVFVGREAELGVLDQEVAQAVAGEGRIVLVLGDEGIGKTSLALETTRLARERGCTVLWGQCHEAGGAPAYWPWIQILRRYLETADPETLRDDLGESAAAVRWITPMFHARCPDLATADCGEITRFHVVDGVTQFLKRVAARRPLVLVLDDLHHADGDSLHLFHFLATETAEAPLLVLGAYRGAGAQRAIAAELARVASEPRTTVLRLAGFEVAEVRRYVAAATMIEPSETLADAIQHKTEGNPLFVAEVTRLLAATGRLSEDPVDGEFRLVVPATRRQAIADRLARLSDRCRRLLGVAAVIGYDFASELLRRVLAEQSSAVQNALDEAIGEQLVRVSDDEPGAHRFAHVLVRDVLYEDLAVSERRGLHGRVAEALATRCTGGGTTARDAEAPLAAIAHHYLEAATGAGDFGRALDWVVAAGDRAAAMMAHEEAARHYGVALRVLERVRPATPMAMNDLLLKLAEVRWRAGDMNGAREAGQRALTLAKDVGEPAAIAAAALTFAGRLPGFGAIVSDTQVVSELEQALARLPSAATGLRAHVMARLAEELAYAPRRHAEPALGPQAIELARDVGDPSVLAAVLRTTQWWIWTPDDVARRRPLAAEMIALADRTRDRVLGLDGQLLRLWSAIEHGEIDVAWGQLATCTRLAGELHLPHYAWVTAAARICLALATGRLDAAERLADEVLQKGERSGDPMATLFVGIQRQHVKYLRGRFDEVTEWLRGVLVSFPLLASGVESSLVMTDARVGQHERVRAELARLAADDFASIPRNALWLMNMAFLADACASSGDTETAPRLYAQLAPFTAYNVLFPPAIMVGPVSHYSGGLAALIGDEAAARRHYEHALALAGQTGSRQWTARTQIAYGRLLSRSGSPADVERGARLVASGRGIANELGLEPVIREADAALVPSPRAETRRALFRHLGDEWEIEFHGRRGTVAHRVGMTYLRCLLERPGTPIPAIELASLGGDAMLVDRNGGPMVDRKAVREVQRRIAEIDAEIADCERRNAVVSADRRRERAECAAYVGGRATVMVSAADRARSGVTKAIARASQAIRKVHEDFAYHLDRHVETGRLCVYVPDPAKPVTFEL